MSYFTLSNVIGSVEDIEIAIDSPSGESVPAQVQEISSGTFKAEFCPKVAGEHQIFVSFGNEPVPGSPFPCKVYNVEAIQVRECKKGIVGKPVTFLVETSQAGPGNLEVTGKTINFNIFNFDFTCVIDFTIQTKIGPDILHESTDTIKISTYINCNQNTVFLQSGIDFNQCKTVQ